MRQTARAVFHVGLALTLLLGPGSSMLPAQTAPAAGAQATAAATPGAPPSSAASKATTTAATTKPTTGEAEEAAAPVAETFSKEQLEQLVAPIALYPDALLMQILMAATYPIEIVEADRFMRKNPSLKDKALEEKLLEEDWDPSVKSLCTLPDVLKKMSENLDWTQDLGDAFLGQKSEILDTVQVMRGKANDAGTLKTTEQQVVTVKEEKIIVIESASPEVVYVPTYSPTAVYPGWYYPSWYYPPMYPYYPVGAGLVTFGVGVAVGAALWGGCHWGWGRGNVYINHNSYNNFNRNTNINHNNLSGNRGSWNHDASHRGGVNYKNSATASQYGGKAGSNRVSKGQAQASAQARGYSGGGAGSRQGGTASASAQGRQGQAGQATGQRASSASANRTASGQKASGAKAGSYSGSGSGTRSGSYSGGSSGRSAYSGSSKPSYDRYSSSRGSYSRGSTSYGGSRGGGMRSGGGRRR